MRPILITSAAIALTALAATVLASSPPWQAPKTEPAPAVEPEPAGWTTAVEPKALSTNVERGLNWLVAHQHENGGWGQGEESRHMGQHMAKLAGKPNVADTCIATLSLLRSGSTPSDGTYADTIRRGVEFVCSEIEQSDNDSLSITSVNGTRVQGKLGPYVDTFLASVMLPEVRDRMPDAAGNQRVSVALDKVLRKIQVNQKDDGTWENRGWAPALAQSMAAKGMNRALQAGAVVDEDALARIEGAARREVSSNGGLAAPGAAGIELYAGASNLGTLQDSVNSNRQRARELEEIAETADDAGKRQWAADELARFAKAEADCTAVQRSIIERLDDKQFIAGFGSNGGEEFLSYMNIAESLVAKADNDWLKWDTAMTANLNRIQNNDGSWTGHHCITGRTFCTASALLVLMADRTPIPVEALAKK